LAHPSLEPRAIALSSKTVMMKYGISHRHGRPPSKSRLALVDAIPTELLFQRKHIFQAGHTVRAAWPRYCTVGDMALPPAPILSFVPNPTGQT
jgi:hypothetical protein